MKTIVLAAGYGTRLQPVIGDFPKPLVEVGGGTVLDHLMTRLLAIQDADDIVLVSNARYVDHFRDWQARKAPGVTVLDDGSTHNDNRRGAIGDIAFAIGRAALDDDLLIVAADNVLMFGLDDLLDRFQGQPDVWIGVRFNPNRVDQRRRGVVEIDADGRIRSFEEKPTNPRSEWAAAPLYLLPREVAAFVEEYLSAGGNPDAPGFLMEALVTRRVARAWELPGDILDIGSPGLLEAARSRMAAG